MAAKSIVVTRINCMGMPEIIGCAPDMERAQLIIGYAVMRGYAYTVEER